MQVFKSKEDLEERKLYEILLKNGNRAIVFRDGEEIKSTAHGGERTRNDQYDIEPCHIFSENEIVEFALYPDEEC